MRPYALSLLLAASAVRAQSSSPAPTSGWSCDPAMDVRPLVSLEYAGHRIESPHDAAALPSEGHQRLAAFFLAEVCRHRGSALQQIVMGVSHPVRVVLTQQCRDGNSEYNIIEHSIRFSDFGSCGRDAEAVLYHELGHALFWEALGSHSTPGVVVELLFAHPYHDDTIMDREDRTLRLMMDAHTEPAMALNEGLADGISMAFFPGASRMTYFADALATETGSPAWREKTWQEQQSNEWLVGLVLRRYLGAADHAGYQRLAGVRRVLAGRGPHNLEELLHGLMDADPVNDVDRIDRILHDLHANWDSERAEISRLPR